MSGFHTTAEIVDILNESEENAPDPEWTARQEMRSCGWIDEAATARMPEGTLAMVDKNGKVIAWDKQAGQWKDTGWLQDVSVRAADHPQPLPVPPVMSEGMKVPPTLEEAAEFTALSESGRTVEEALLAVAAGPPTCTPKRETS